MLLSIYIQNTLIYTYLYVCKLYLCLLIFVVLAGAVCLVYCALFVCLNILGQLSFVWLWCDC